LYVYVPILECTIDEMSVPARILDAMTKMSMPDLAGLDWFITRAELLRVGFSRAAIASLVDSGELVSLSRGVYLAAEVADRLRMLPAGEALIRAGAALATAGPGAVISHRTAAELHGLDLLTASPQVTITRAPGQGSRSGKTGLHVHAARLPARHVGSRLAIPVTTIARTVVDLARSQDFRAGVVVADSALHKQLTTKSQLRQVLAELPRGRGVQRAVQVVEFSDGRSESPLESIARVAFRDCGLRAPELQVELGGDGFAARVDFFWREFRTVVEVDGALKYDDRSAAMRQLRRDAWLRRAGFEVEHFGWQEITQTPDLVAATIRIAFRRGLERGETQRPAS
jgi:hypothetical protein